MRFSYAGRDYYILASDIAPESIARVTGSAVQGPVGGQEYLNRNMTLDDEHLFAGKALMVRFNALGDPTGSTVGDVVVSDDDGLIQFDCQNGAPDSETRAGAQALPGGGRLVVVFNHTDGSSSMMLVEVSYRGTPGTGRFDALRATTGAGVGVTVQYIPRTGSVDLGTVQTFLGGNGNDLVYGGIDHDQVFGGAGNDELTGGRGDDVMSGGDGNDRLYSGSDNDLMSGDAGADLLDGSKGNDRLDGGAGVETLIGGGPDVFVFTADGATDRISDFVIGQDKIDLDVGFASLTITTLAPGRVQIAHGAEVIIVTDPGGLSAAVLTAADLL